jgi:hypothetical protein
MRLAPDRGRGVTVQEEEALRPIVEAVVYRQSAD